MLPRLCLGLTAVAGLTFAGASAQAQQAPVPAVPPGTQSTVMPAGSIPIHRDGAPDETSHMMQAVGGSGLSNTVATASTPGVLDNYGLPSLDAAKAGNLAGLASYCVRNHLVHGNTLRVVGRKLAKRPDVQNDQYYSLGGQGLLQSNTNVPFDVSTLDLSHRTQLCAQIRQRGQDFK